MHHARLAGYYLRHTSHFFAYYVISSRMANTFSKSLAQVLDHHHHPIPSKHLHVQSLENYEKLYMMFHFEFLQVPIPVYFWCSTNFQINLRSKRYLEPFHVTSCMSMIRSFSVNAKNASKKIEALIRSIKFLSAKAALISINLLYGHAWKTVVISGLVLLVAT